MAKEPKAPEIVFVDNQNAPDIYATGATGFFVSNGAMAIGLFDFLEKQGFKYDRTGG